MNNSIDNDGDKYKSGDGMDAENSNHGHLVAGGEKKERKQKKLARQLRENLAKRKSQSRARNTKPRKFTK